MLTHKGTQTIETPRLILRRAIMEDAQPMFDNWASDPEVTKFLTWPAYENADTAKVILHSWIKEYEKEDFYQWMIVLKEIGQPIGSISVVEHNDRIGKAEIGYCIGKAWWHRGIMTEALQAVIDFLFGEAGMNRIEARHDPNNPHSGDVMKKCGMKYEGTARASDRNNQGICDAAHYAILRSDWEKQATAVLFLRNPNQRRNGKMNIVIRRLTPEIGEELLTFFDNAAFADHEEWSFCYCLECHLDHETQENTANSKPLRRKMAKDFIDKGIMQGYLVYDGNAVVGWCNANDKSNYRYLSENRDFVTDDTADKKIKSVYCFIISAPYRGKGIANMLLERVCSDAEEDGYDFVEAYPFTDEKFEFQYHGTIRMYERNGFSEYEKRPWFTIMRRRVGSV